MVPWKKTDAAVRALQAVQQGSGAPSGTHMVRGLAERALQAVEPDYKGPKVAVDLRKAAAKALETQHLRSRASTQSSAPHLIPKTNTLPEGSLVGVVVSAGKMQRTVKVRTTKQKFNTFLKRHYLEYPTFMVSDPANSLREGDVVRIAPWKKNKAKRISHIVTKLMVPFGTSAEERPAVMGLEELVRRKREDLQKSFEKMHVKKAAAKAAAEEQEGLITPREETKSDLTGKKIDGLREQALENEVEAEQIAKDAAEQAGVDLEKEIGRVRL